MPFKSCEICKCPLTGGFTICDDCDELIPDEDLDYLHPFLWTDQAMDHYEGEAYIDQ